jgi:hypothetical protein
MRHLLIVVSLIQIMAFQRALAQVEENDMRIKKESFFERGGVQYTTEYSYDNSGKVIRILSQYLIGGTVAEMEERKIRYSENLAVVNYLPSASAKKDHRVKYYLRDMDLGDVDSIILKNGQIQEMIEVRHRAGYPSRSHHRYKYSSNKDILEIKITLSKSDTTSRLFQYKADKLVKIVETSRSLKTEFLIGREKEILDTVEVFYTQNNIARKALSYIFEYNDNTLSSVKDVSPYGGAEIRTFEYDGFGNLVMLATRSDTGTSGFRYEYELGKGNAALFRKYQRLYEFLLPSVQ